MRKYFCLLLPIALLLAACKFESEGVYTDDTTEEYQLYDYYVDEYGNEGIVAYIFSSTYLDRKYIMVISSDEACLPWGFMGECIYKKDSVKRVDLITSSYSLAMFQIMKSYGVEKFPAQAWCDAKNAGEEFPRAGSWHLPSKYEYDLIFGTNGSMVSSLNSALTGIGATPFSSEKYWTCTEDYDGYITINGRETDYDSENRAVITSVDNTTYGDKERWFKKNNYYVRALKYVYYYD